jgi:hypothetical protein
MPDALAAGITQSYYLSGKQPDEIVVTTRTEYREHPGTKQVLYVHVDDLRELLPDELKHKAYSVTELSGIPVRHDNE